jgi:site-specific recombinase XerD
MPATKKRLPIEVLTREEAKRLFDACGDATWTARRDRALLSLLYRAGLRLNEALMLRACDIDSDRGAVRVLHGKGGVARTVGIDRWGLGFLRIWSKERDSLAVTPGKPFICSRNGRMLSQGQVRRRVHELGRKAGIVKRVHPHGLRHTFAAELREEGVDIAVIRRQLGHAGLLTTIRYLDHVAGVDVLRAITRRTTDV